MYSGLPRSVTWLPLDTARAPSEVPAASAVGAPGRARGCARRARSVSRCAPPRTDPRSPRRTTWATPGPAGGRPDPPWSQEGSGLPPAGPGVAQVVRRGDRSEEHTSELQSRFDLVCRLLLEKKK